MKSVLEFKARKGKGHISMSTAYTHWLLHAARKSTRQVCKT
jgi:hypothetical protein